MVFANIIELGLYSLIATIGWGFDPNNVFNLPGFIMFIILQIIVLCAYSSIFVFTAMLTGSYGKSLAINIFILLFAPNILGFIDELKSKAKLDGIECFHPSASKEQRKVLLKYAKENNLYISGGSDYHGKLKPDIEIGIGRGDINIPKEILEWL